MTVHVAEPDSGSEWPAMSPIPDHGWPAFKVPVLPVLPFSEEVQALISEKEMQKEVVEICRKYFYGKLPDGSWAELEKGEDEDEEEDGEYLSDEDEEEEEDEDRDFGFLSNLFAESRELREYYENKQESGAFYCLVCGGIGVKVWKTFKGCLSLVQHCNGIGKTKRRRAHRALAQVICQVLGRDFGRLPISVLKEQDQAENDEKSVDRSSGESGGAGKNGEMINLEDHVTDKLVGDSGNGVDAEGGCGKPVNHEAFPLENLGEGVNEGVITLSLSPGSGKEWNVDPLVNIKGDNDVGTGLVDGNPGKTTVSGPNENVEN